MKVIYYPSASGPYDADAADYIARVNTVDAANGASGGLEPGLQDIIHILFRDLKLDASPFAGVTNFAALKASCLLAGPRTRQGCAVPLLASMPTPILVNFRSIDYARKTGLLAGIISENGQSKAINTRRSNSADPQNNCSFSVFVSSVGATTATTKIMLGSQIEGTNQKIIAAGTSINSGQVSFRCQDTGALAAGVGNRAPGLIGASRSLAASYTIRNDNQSATATSTSVVPQSQNLFVCATTADGTNPANVDDSVYSFYHIGEAVTLSTLDQCISAYMKALNALTLT